MDFASLLVSVLVSGSICQTRIKANFYKIHRYDGQLLYIKVLTSGFWCFVLASLICLTCNYLQPHVPGISFNPLKITESLLQPTGLTSAEINQGKWIICLSVMTLTIAFLAEWFQNRIYPELVNRVYSARQSLPSTGQFSKKSYLLYIYQKAIADSPIDNMYLESCLFNQLLLFSLKDRKVYVGIVQKMGEPTEKTPANQEVVILPIMSGYRHHDTLEIDFTTFYDNISEDGNSNQPISLCIKTEQIASVSYFDFDTYVSSKGSVAPQKPKFNISDFLNNAN